MVVQGMELGIQILITGLSKIESKVVAVPTDTKVLGARRTVWNAGRACYMHAHEAQKCTQYRPRHCHTRARASEERSVFCG